MRRLAVLLLTLVALSGLPALHAPSAALAASRASGKIIAREVRHDAPLAHGTLVTLGGGRAAAASAGQTGSGTLALTSEVVDAAQRFDFVGVHWRAAAGREDALVVEVRTSADGAAWSEWVPAPEQDDMVDVSANEHFGAPIPAVDARYAQYRVWMTDGDARDARSVALTFMDVSDLNAGPLARLADDLGGAWKDFAASFAAAASTNPARILTRQDWGADESLMQWTPQYVPWKKAIVHHTVTSNTYTSAAPEIRAIYYYHAVTRGWGDIGYQYVVDKYGNIWTGRQGGDDVVGGHAYGWNEGAFGVASLGEFTTLTPPPALLNGVATIIAMKFAQRGIQPYGADSFTHKEEDSSGNWVPVTTSPPNIQGHRDANYIVGGSGGQTSCPGTALYAQLNTIRTTAQNLVNGTFNNLVSLAPSLPATILSNSTTTVPIIVKNVGATTISAATTQLSYRILSGATGATLVSQGPMTGLGGDLPPGGQQIVAAALNVPATGQYVLRWDLWRQGAGWYSQLYGTPVRDQWLVAVQWDDTWLSDTTPATMTVGQSTSVSVTVKNTGAVAWPMANVHLSYHWVSDVTQRTVVWNGNRASLPFDVQPGQQVTLPITVTAPSYPTRYQLQFDFVWEGQFWFGDKGVEPLVKIVNVPFDFHATYTVPPVPTVTPDQTITVPLTITNTGTSTWPANGTPFVELGTHWYQNGALVEWDGLRTPLPQTVAPGQSVSFLANVNAPSTAGTFQLQFDLALEGISWFSSKGAAPGTATVTVRNPTYGARYAPGAVSAIAASVQTSVPMTLTNTGDFAWTAPTFDLGYHLYDASGRLVWWDGTRTALPSAVQPGQSVSVQANLSMPSQAGSYTVQWDMVQEGVTWFSGRGVATQPQAITIGSLSYGASYDASQTPSAMATQMTTRVLVRVANGSSFAFAPSTSVYLSYHWFDSSGNAVIWDGKRSALSVPAGGSAYVWTDVVGPANAGAYRLQFDLVQEGVAWFSGKGVAPATRSVSVVTVPYGALYSGSTTASAAAGSTITMPLSVTNTGTMPWPSTQVFLAYHLYLNGAPYVWDGQRTALPSALAPGQSATVNATVAVPQSAGTYEVRFDLVQEGVTWFSGQGVPTGTVTLTAQ